jgi:cbb3-type cytochrome oxidase subunit 1
MSYRGMPALLQSRLCGEDTRVQTLGMTFSLMPLIPSWASAGWLIPRARHLLTKRGETPTLRKTDTGLSPVVAKWSRVTMTFPGNGAIE